MDRLALQQRWDTGVRPAMLHFWRPVVRSDGSLGPGCLSQFWPCRFELQGRRYSSAEQWMMASKARLFGDARIEARILSAHDPLAIRALGREVEGFVLETWRAHRLDVVVRGNLAKFEQDDALGAYLQRTGEVVLVEASPHDAIWGIGLPAGDPRASRPGTWRGYNLLGFALMEVRRLLSARATPALGRC